MGKETVFVLILFNHHRSESHAMAAGAGIGMSWNVYEAIYDLEQYLA